MNQKLSYNLAFRKFYDSAFDVCVALSCVVCMHKNHSGINPRHEVKDLLKGKESTLKHYII